MSARQTTQPSLQAPLTAFAIVSAVVVLVVSRAYWPLIEWIDCPMVYEGDGLWNLFVIKTVLVTGWYGSNASLGAPFGATFLDFAKPESFFLLYITFMGQFTKNIALIHNLFYCSGFLMVAWSALAVLRNGFRLSWTLAVVGTVLYTFQPYHFLRISHLFLSDYLAVPLAALLILKICSSRIPFFESGNFQPASWSIWVCAAFIASTSIYYAFFSICLIFGIGLLETVRTGVWRRCAGSVVLCTLIGVLVMTNLAPSLIYRATAGKNPEVAVRSLAEADMYALRPIQLLLPVADHNIKFLANPARTYEADASTPINENRASALGFLGTLGFVVLLFALLSGHKILTEIPLLAECARTNALALFLGMAGGGGMLFAILGETQFRALNRISIFIAFFSIAGLMTILQHFLGKVSGRKQHVLTVTAGMLLVLAGLYDQIPGKVRPDTSLHAATFQSDRRFVQQLQTRLPKDAQILQLPYIGFPEVAPLHKEPAYSHLRGYLHSDTLRWSYAGMKGREGDLWHRALSSLPLTLQIETAREAGFNGIWLDRRAFPDDGQVLENNLQKEGLRLEMESEDQMLAFYPLSATGNTPPALILPMVLGQGFYPWEGKDDNRWAWTRGDASCFLTNASQELQHLHVSFTLNSLVPRQVTVLVNNKVYKTAWISPGNPVPVNFDVDCQLGRTEIRLRTDAPPSTPGNNDRRLLAMMLASFQISKSPGTQQ